MASCSEGCVDSFSNVGSWSCSRLRTCCGLRAASARPVSAAPRPPAGHRRDVGEVADHAGVALDFLIVVLDQVGAPDLFPVLILEAAEGEHFFPGPYHELCRLWEGFGRWLARHPSGLRSQKPSIGRTTSAARR